MRRLVELRSRRLLPAAILSLGLVASEGVWAQLGPTPETLNLFQLIARSDLVALVKVRDGTLKYAMVDLVETFKGTAPGSRLRIAFRDFNYTRARDEDMIVFPSGQQEILFLVPYRTPRRKKDIE